MPESRIPDSHARFGGYRSFLENEEESEFSVPRLSVPFSSALYCVCIESYEPRSEYRISKSEYTRLAHLSRTRRSHKNFSPRANRIWPRGSDRGVKIEKRIDTRADSCGRGKKKKQRKEEGSFHESESRGATALATHDAASIAGSKQDRTIRL